MKIRRSSSRSIIFEKNFLLNFSEISISILYYNMMGLDPFKAQQRKDKKSTISHLAFPGILNHHSVRIIHIRKVKMQSILRATAGTGMQAVGTKN